MAKIILSLETRPTVTITLPVSKAQVEFYDDFTAGDYLDMPLEGDKRERSVWMIERLAKSWEFVDKDENPLPINMVSLKILKFKDLQAMIDQVDKTFKATDEYKALGKEKKSPSSDTTPQNSDTKKSKHK